MVELSRWGPIESQDAAVQPIISGLTQELNALATGYPKVAAMKTRPFSTHQFAASSRGSENVTETGCKPIATPNPMGKKMSTTQQIWGVFHPESSRSDGMEFTHRDRCHLFSWHFYRVFSRGKVWFPLEFVTKRGTPLLRDFSSSSTEGSINLSSCRYFRVRHRWFFGRGVHPQSGWSHGIKMGKTWFHKWVVFFFLAKFHHLEKKGGSNGIGYCQTIKLRSQQKRLLQEPQQKANRSVSWFHEWKIHRNDRINPQKNIKKR